MNYLTIPLLTLDLVVYLFLVYYAKKKVNFFAAMHLRETPVSLVALINSIICLIHLILRETPVLLMAVINNII